MHTPSADLHIPQVTQHHGHCYLKMVLRAALVALSLCQLVSQIGKIGGVASDNSNVARVALEGWLVTIWIGFLEKDYFRGNLVATSSECKVVYMPKLSRTEMLSTVPCSKIRAASFLKISIKSVKCQKAVYMPKLSRTKMLNTVPCSKCRGATL